MTDLTEILIADVLATWPEVLRRAAEVAGVPAAAGLAAVFGGGAVYVPRPEAIGEGHALARAMGIAGARAFAKELGGIGCMVEIPLGSGSTIAVRAARVRQLTEEGYGQAEIARMEHIPVRSVRRWQKRHRQRGLGPSRAARPATPDLFD